MRSTVKSTPSEGWHNHDSEIYYNNFLENENKPLFHTPTRYDNGRGLCTNNILSKTRELKVDVRNLVHKITDHKPNFGANRIAFARQW